MALIRYGAGKITAQVNQTTDKSGKKVTSAKDIKPAKETGSGCK